MITLSIAVYIHHEVSIQDYKSCVRQSLEYCFNIQRFPAMLILDQESSLMKVVREAEINLVDLKTGASRSLASSSTAPRSAPTTTLGWWNARPTLS